MSCILIPLISKTSNSCSKHIKLFLVHHRPIQLTQGCTQFNSLEVKVPCAVHWHDNAAFTFKWYGNTWNKTFNSQRIWTGYNIELAVGMLVYQNASSGTKPWHLTMTFLCKYLQFLQLPFSHLMTIILTHWHPNQPKLARLGILLSNARRFYSSMGNPWESMG